MPSFRRGEVWWVTFDQSIGGEIRKTRPAVIISNNAANTALNRVVVVPLSSKIENVYPSETLISLAGTKSKAMADQITTAAKERLIRHMAVISATDLRSIEEVLFLHLGIRRV